MINLQKKHFFALMLFSLFFNLTVAAQLEIINATVSVKSSSNSAKLGVATNFNPSSIIGNPTAKLTLNSTGLSLNVGLNNKTAAINIGSSTVHNHSVIVNSSTGLNSNIGQGFNPNSISFSSHMGSSSVANNNLMNISHHKCFFDTIGNLTDRLQKSNAYYTNLCNLNNKPRVNRLIMVSKIVGLIEAYQNVPLKQSPPQLAEAMKSLDTFSDFKFSSYLVNIKEGLTKGQNVTIILKNLWSAINDELENTAKNYNYPFFFRGNVWKLIQTERVLTILREQFSKRMNECIPNNWEDILQISDLNIDQNFKQIFKPHGGSCQIDAYDVPINSNAFENGGIALTFWGSENIQELQGKQKSVFVGYINNNIVFNYNLVPQNYSIVHRLQILDKYIDVKSDSNCATYYFVVLSIQKECDRYKLYYSVRFLASNTRQSGEVELTADKVENLHIIFDRNSTYANSYYKNFKYSLNHELTLITYSLNSANWKTFSQRATCVSNCQYSNGNRCLFCNPSAFNLGGSCVTNCPNNTYSSNSTCIPCDPKCSGCNGPNNGNCLNCKEPFYFSNGVCDVKCPSNLAPDQNRQCKPCGNNCLACKDLRTCGVCDAISFIKDGQCVPTCGENFFKSYNPNACKPCPNSCLTCENADKCLTCKVGFFLKGKDCVPSCGNEFWGDLSTKTCKPCENNCKTCTDSVTCVECNKGYHNLNQDCVTTCPVGTVSVNGVCVKCTQPQCEVCNANNVADCKKCNTSNFLKGSNCFTNCGTGFYADTNKNCQTCPKDCNVCTKEKCLQCKDNQFILNDNTCVKECPNGYISSGNICVKCTFPSVCKRCLNNQLDSCTKCYPGKVLLNGKCLDKCPEKYFANGEVCEPCQVGCENCKNKYNCEVCSKSHFWQNHVCVERCDEGFAAIGNNICNPCKVLGCTVCSNDLSVCNKCQDKKYLYNNQCIEKCPLGAYPLPKMTCDTCMNECIECSSKTACNKCKPGKVLQGTNCVSVCDDGFVPINGQCTKCKNLNCRRCLSNDLAKCQECPVGLFLYNRDCLKICPSKTYQKDGACLDCKSPCNNCVNENECVDCIPKFSLHGKNCTDNCPQRTLSVNNKCFNCHDKNCLKCNDVVANTCIQCDKGLVLFNGVCVQSCPENYYNNNGTCKPCMSNCKKCKDATTCDQCVDKLNLKDGNQCVKDCGVGYTLFPNNICRKCHTSCKQCKNTNVNECTECHSNYLLFGSECRSTCPEGTFASNKMTCEPCPMNNCRQCKSGTTCTDCNSGFVLENNTCKLPPCSDGWVLKPKSNQCTPCEVSNCKSCPNTNTKKCDNCISNYYLIGDFKCEKDCIIGTYKNPTNRRCENCSKKCLTCTDQLHCSQCEVNYYLHEGVCVSECPTGYSKLSGKCMPCEVKNCNVCPNNKNCDKCNVPLVLQDGLCEKDCKLGYFSNSGICKKCPLFCDQCENENKCRVCQKGKILSADDKCIDECPSGSVVKGGKCILCKSDPNCDKCNSTDIKQCLSCKGNLVLKSNTCVDNCGDNFYVNTRKCSPCKQGCKKCQDGNTCIECDNGRALHQDNCVTDCPAGYRKENGKCIQCQVGCVTCNTNQCLVCLSGLLLENGNCVKLCSKGFFTVNNIKCQPCDAGCQTCLTEKTCSICRDGLHLKNGVCVEKCGVGYVAVSGKCEKCGLNCDECNKLNPKECTVCQKGKVILNGQCLDTCPAKYYNENGACLPCLNGCDVCQFSKVCNKCNPSLYLTNDSKSCVTSCPDGYKPNQGKCAPCEDKKCLKCGSDTKICDICNTPNLQHNGVCVPSCPNGYFREETGKRCQKCNVSCTKCVENKKCTECAQGFSLQNDTCVNTCRPGSISVNSVCKDCQTPSCEVCKSNLSTCERCEKGKVLFTVTNSTLNQFVNLTRKLVINSTTNTSNSTIGINSTICMNNCPVGFYENNRACLPCGQNCDRCTNSIQCNLCSSGYVLQDGKCQLRCNKYYVEKNGECVRCEDQKCINCDPVTRKECKVCDENYVLKNNECRTNCGSSFFKFEVTKNNSICKPCSFKCDVCRNENTCDKCMEGGLLKNNQCVMDCGKGWVVKDNTKCVECTSKNCLVCDPNNPDRCITCSSDSYLKSGLCVKTCGDKYFASDKGLCLPCVDPSCITCSPNDKCSVCEKGKVILNGACHNNCPSGMVPNKDNVCVSCNDKNCNKCELNNLNKCSKCNNGYLLQPDLTCNSKCPSKYYNHLNERCLPCAKNCDVCRNEKECTVCSGKMVLDHNNMCTDNCDKGYVDVKGKCVKCKDKNCSKCQSNDQAICEVCLPGFYLYHGECVSSCPSKTFALGSNCVNCDKNCLQCTSETECKQCDKNFILFNKVCVTQCPEGYLENKGECFKCPNFEKTRSCDRQNPIIPISCRDKYLLDKICVDNCPDGKFPDTKRVCQPCGPECVKCASLSECKKCSEKTVLYKGNCTNTCPVGSINVLGQCVDCKNQNCNQCQQSDLTKCTTCKDKLFFLNNDCLSNCPKGYYVNGQNCLKCDDKCAECKNGKTCDRCLNQFVNLDGTCVSECPKGTALRNGKCYACADTKCNLCDNVDLNNCLSCRDGYLFNKVCNNECAQGYRADNVTRTCVPCSKYCDKCNDKGCLVCTKGYYFSETDNRFCMECSDPNMVIVNNKTCEKCKVQGCKRCSEGNTNSCKVCDSAKVLVNGVCLDKCPNGTYKVGQSCNPCEKGCKVCSNSNTCDECEKPSVLFNGKCVPNCPTSWVNNGKGLCVQCAQQECDLCDITNKGLCLTCKLPSMLYKGQCYKVCPNGTFPDSPNCKDCPNGCSVCNKNKCEGCSNNLKLKGSDCVKECGNGFFVNGNTCEKCIDTNCAVCSPSNTCKKCNPNTYLMESTHTCVVTCKDGYYVDKERGLCSKCSEGCANCKNNEECEKCEKGFNLFEGDCNKSCPEGFSSVEGTCKPCDQGCNNCPNSQFSCVTCGKGNLFNKKCIPVCPKGTYVSEGKCENCDIKCDECTSKDQCLRCKSEFNIYKGRCIDKCSDGKVEINGKCIPCGDKNCKSCLRDTNICVECNSPFVISDNTCVPSCPEGTYAGNDKICVPCEDGCLNCTSNSNCLKCTPGFYLLKNKCIKDCPRGMWGNCNDNICYNCLEACEDCVDGTATNCPKCSNGYFKNGKICVKELGCRRGTYPNKETRRCTSCKVPYCAYCLDQSRCRECVRGFELNKNGQCTISKTFIPVISQNPRLFSSSTFKLYRNTEIKSFNQDLKGTGVNADNVSFTFWLRKNSEISGETKIFETESGSIAMNLRLEVVPLNGKPVCRLTLSQDQNVNVLELGGCSYQELHQWTFFSFSLSQVSDKGYVDVNIANNNGINRKKNLNFPISKTVTFINNNSTLVFNKNINKAELLRSSPFEIANFNILDYDATIEDLQDYALLVPNDCDYTCIDCKGKCNLCPGNIKPTNDGFCPASFISFSTDYQLLNSTVSVDLRSKVTHRLDSERYGLYLWFNPQNLSNRNSTEIVNLYYNYTQSESIIRFFINNTRLWIQLGQESFQLFENNTITLDEWYFIGASVKYQTLVVYLSDLHNMNQTRVINLKYLPNRLTEDSILMTGPIRELNNTSSSFNGAFYDIRLYVNNIPNQDDILNQYSKLPCPKNCNKCTKSLTCGACKSGFKLSNNICVDNKLSAPLELLDKYSFYNNDSITLNVPGTFNLTEYTISFFYRRKIHSLPSLSHNVLSIEGTDGRVYPLVQQLNGQNDDSTFTVLGQNSTGSTFAHDFSNEIYNFIHFIITVDIPKKTLTYYINDGKEQSFSKPINTGIRKLILGDSTRNELNFEIGNLYIYEGITLKEEFSKLRSTTPLDCDPGCISCDYKTGGCNACLNGKPTETRDCSNILRGFSHAHLYNSHHLDQRLASVYSSSLNNVYKRDVNSMEYSVLGYFRLFNKNAISKNKTSRFQLFRVSNREDRRSSQSSNVIGLEIVTNNNEGNYYITYNDGKVVGSHLVKDLNITTEWVLLLASVNVREKTIKYGIQQLNSARVYIDTIKLTYYPEKLVEQANLNLFGFGTESSQFYNTLDLQFYRFYIGVNVKFNLDLLEKFKKNLPVPEDPKCSAECERCILSENQIVQCLSCVKGYELENDQCYKTDSKYVLLADQNVYTFTSPKTDMAVPPSALLYPKNTITFYFRRNYGPLVQTSTAIFKGGNVGIALNGGIKGESSLVVSINKNPNSLLFNIDQNADEDYNWYLIIINYSSNVLDVIVKNEKYREKKAINVDNNFKIEITSISFNTINDQVSIYAPNMILRNFYETSFVNPSTFCNLECDVCIENKCVECQYGMDTNGKCIQNPISIGAIRLGKNSNYANQYSLRKYLDNPKPLRSRSWAVRFTFELTSEFNTYFKNGISLFTLVSGNDIKNSNILFNVNFNSNNSFFITVSNRHYYAATNSAYGFATNSFKTTPTNSQYIVAISYDDDKNELNFFAYNSNDNYVKQTFNLKGRAENLNLDANLIFGSNIQNSNNYIIYEHIKFYFEGNIDLNTVNKFLEARLHNFQNSCLENTRISCLKCNSNSNLIGNLCSPVKNSLNAYLNKIKLVTNLMTDIVDQKFFFQNDSTQFTVSFWYKLFTYTNDPFGILSLTMQDGKSSYPLLKIHYSNNNLFADLYDSTNKQVNGIKYDNMFSAGLQLSWIYISVSVDIPSNTINLYIYNHKQNNNRILTRSVPSTKLNLVLNSSKYATIGLGYETSLKGVGYHYETSSIVFTSGWFAKDTNKLDLYRTRVPRKCSNRCMNECDEYNICPSTGYHTSDIIINDIYSNNESLKGKTDISSLQTINLFRYLSGWLPDTDGNPVWHDFLLSFELDIPSLLSSTYKPNNNVMLALSNSVNPKHPLLTMNDVIPSEILQYGILGVERTNEGIKFWIGSSIAGNTITYYNLNLQNLNETSKITIQIFIDSESNTARIIAYIDDLRTFYNIHTVYPLQPFSSNTLIYTHPNLNGFRINVNNSRFLYDYNLNIRGKSQDMTAYSSRRCGSECVKCSFVPKGMIFTCDRCQKGFILINNMCLKSNNM